MGHADYLAPGDWNAICFRCGMKHKASMLRKHWTGPYLCPKCWEPRHPQDFVRALPDIETPPWTQPPPTAGFVGGQDFISTSGDSVTPDLGATGTQYVSIDASVFVCTLNIPNVAGPVIINNYGGIGRILNTFGVPYTLNNLGGVLQGESAAASLLPSSSSILIGDVITYTLTRSGASCYATTASLVSSNPAVAAVPASVSFLAGGATASFTTTGLAPGNTTITATLGTSVNATVLVSPKIISLTPNPATVDAGSSLLFTVTLDAAAAVDETVTLVSSDPTKLTVPASVTVLTSQSTATFNATGIAGGSAIVTATLNGSATSSVTVVIYNIVLSGTTVDSYTVGNPTATAWTPVVAPVTGLTMTPMLRIPGLRLCQAVGDTPNFQIWAANTGASWSEVYIDAVDNFITSAWSPTRGIAVMVGHQVLWSNDGLTWTKVTTNFANNDEGTVIWMADSNQKFVTVPGLNNNSAGTTNTDHSLDGKLWFLGGTLPAGAQYLYASAVWAESQIVAFPGAFGGYQRASFSQNGVSYIQGGVLPAVGLWKACAYSHSLDRVFAALNNSSTAVYSDDRGLNWFTVTLPVSTSWVCAFWTGTLFVLLSGSGTVYTSPTGVTGSWTAHATGGNGHAAGQPAP